MAEKTKTQDEPSIEEILGSIRRIIAEDDEEDVPVSASNDDLAKVSKALDAVDEQVEDIDDEPLELTNKIDPDGTIEQTVTTSGDDTQISEEQEPAPVQAPVEAEEKIILVEETPVMTDDVEKPQDALLSETTADATTAVMAKLARHTALTDEGHDGITIENIVREMLKPMLKEWLDQNLPELVQRMVERELEKLSKRL